MILLYRERVTKKNLDPIARPFCRPDTLSGSITPWEVNQT